MHAYPSAFPPPPTTNTLSSDERSALVRSSRKLCQLLGDVPRVPDDDMTMMSSFDSTTKSIWPKRAARLPPPLKLSNATTDTQNLGTCLVYHRRPSHHDLVHSITPSIPSPTSSSDTQGMPKIAQRRTKLERLRRMLGREVPTTIIFPTTPTPTTPMNAAPQTPPPSAKPSRTNRQAAHPVDDAHPIAFSINSDENVHAVTLTTRVHPPRPSKTKHVYHSGPLPPKPPMPARLAGDDDAGLIRPRKKMAAGSMIGGADFKAAQRAKREGRFQNGMAEPGELIDMVGFMF